MSAKTKIVVLHMKRMIFTAVMVALVLILAVIVAILLKPKEEAIEEAVPTMYVPGVYTSSVQISDAALDVQIVVDENNINSISLVNLDETMETMYPLIRPALDDLAGQIVSNQSLDNLTYSENNQYTSIVLLTAIEDALEKAASE
ncbi:MAG: hypothetical protein NC242_10820 [Roseburia sp.]|nr:hypothetical protein [Roseburia sp.]MCM1431915.1 hypothetical protein [Muribaculaceae bacterium]